MTTSSPPDAGPPSLGDFPATRADGLRRLAAFVPRAGRAYAEGRNADDQAQAQSDQSSLTRMR